MRLMRTPKSVEVQITNNCNLRCKYCSFFTSASEVDNDLPLEEWLAFFAELNRSAVLSVTLSGGEPLTRGDLPQIIDGIVQNRMRFGLLTNGVLITREFAAHLAQSGRCDSIQVSIDGSIPTTHEAFRGKGTFYKALGGIETLLEHQLSVTVRVTIHRQNVDDLPNIARLLLEEVGLAGFSTNSATYMGLCRKNAEQIQLTTQDRMRAMEILLQLDEVYPGRISAAAGPLAEARMWGEMEAARQAALEQVPGCGTLSGCHGMMEQLAVRADGVIVPCSTLGHLELGRINQDSLLSAWQHPLVACLRQRDQIPLSSFAFCAGCEYLNYCTGSCPGSAFTMVGQVDHPCPDACLQRFLQNGGRLEGATA